MNILVTGANGYVGSYLLGALLSEGHCVTTLTRRPYIRDNTANVVIDNYSPSEIFPSMIGQDVVIHLAGLAHQVSHDKEAAEALYQQVNVKHSLMLANEAKKAGVKRLVFISSIKVNGESTVAEIPFRADMNPAPENAYGRSKLAAEQSLAVLLEGSQTELVIVRPPLVWGGDVKGNLSLLRKLVVWGVPLPIAGIKNKRDLVSLENLSSFICVLVHHPRAAGQTFLVSDGMARNLAQIVALNANKDAKLRILRCPEWVIIKLARLFGMEKRLMGNLEVDIRPSCLLLGWLPNTQGLPDNQNPIAKRP